MGCDIHLFVEYKKDGKWNPADAWTDSKYYPGEKTIPLHLKPFSNRDYDFFGFLADVRNGTWGEPVPVLAERKGFPEDACELIKKENERWNGDAHSHSFFTLAELEEGFDKYKETKFIKRGAILGADNPNPELKKWIDTPEEERKDPPGGYAVAAYSHGKAAPSFIWYKTLEDEIGTSYHKLYDYMFNASIEYGVNKDEIRCVFWFDN